MSGGMSPPSNYYDYQYEIKKLLNLIFRIVLIFYPQEIIITLFYNEIMFSNNPLIS
jgi:hypothetical protein